MLAYHTTHRLADEIELPAVDHGDLVAQFVFLLACILPARKKEYAIHQYYKDKYLQISRSFQVSPQGLSSADEFVHPLHVWKLMHFIIILIT